MDNRRAALTFVVASIGAGFLALSFAEESTAQAPTPLFSDAAARIDRNRTTARQPRRDDADYVRSRLATVDPELLQATGVGERVWLNLFDDVDATAVARAVDSYRPGSVSWRGHIEGEPLSWARFERVGSAVVGTMSIGGRRFALHYAGNGIHSIREIDLSSAQVRGLERDDVLVERAEERPSHGEPRPARAARTIKYGAVYTKDARDDAGGTDGILAVAQLTVTHLNDAMAAQNIEHRFKWGGGKLVNGSDSGSRSEALDKLTDPADRVYDKAHKLRNSKKWDFMGIYFKGNSGGLGWRPRSLDADNEDRALHSVAQESNVNNGGKTGAHETGHNIGGCHPLWNNVDVCEDPVKKFAHGLVMEDVFYEDLEGNVRQNVHTIMGTNGLCRDCGQFPSFSGPNMFEGVVPGDKDSNMSKLINQSAKIISKYR